MQNTQFQDPDIRWKQRFNNLERAFANLESALDLPNLDILQRAGLIQFFNWTFELSWKTLKDLLEYQGFSGFDSPRTVLKQAFAVSLIQKGEVWLDCLEKRNLSSHVYDEAIAQQVENAIRSDYFPVIKALVEKLRAAASE